MNGVRALPHVEKRILELKVEDITKTTLLELFSNKIVSDKNDPSKKKVENPFCHPDEVILIDKGYLPNVKEKTFTTIGRYIFNLFLISSIFNDYIPYVNKTLTSKGIKDIQQMIVDGILDNKITTDQFALFQNRLVWLNNFTELFVPGMSLRLLIPLPEVEQRKKELIEKYKDEIEKGNYVVVADKIEKELLDLAKSILKDDPSWSIYALGGKPSFGNNYKNTQVMVGPMTDLVNGGFKVSVNSLSEGIPKEQYDIYSNMLIMGSYSRGVSTQDGGAKTKELFAAMQSEILDDPGSDCKTTLVKKILITPSNYRKLLYRYIVNDDGTYTELTSDVIEQYFNKTVNLRSPLFCASKKICNICAGNLFYKLNIRNIGLTETKITSTLLNMSLKKMHDSTVKAAEIDPFKYLKFMK